MKKLVQRYRWEIGFIAAEILLMYGLTKLFALLHSMSGDVVFIPPAAAFLTVAVYCFLFREWLFPIGTAVVLSLGLGLVLYEFNHPMTSAYLSLTETLLAFGPVFAFLDGLAAVLAAVLGNLAGAAADRIQETVQKKYRE